ncbi:AraC family transcriptional regulator [Lacticaseibacillus paracasei]|uniref:AraC family transcriptional regulator n=1 Tax=Lacticaseibacillus paracasei TaxID=1597 RepID=UPI0034E8FDD5
MFKENKWLRTDQFVSSELSVFEVGYEDVHPRAPYQYEQLDYYLLHFIVQGEGLFFINNEIHQLSRGQGFLIPPYTDNNYYPLVGNPWSYRWIGVRGSGSKAIFEKAGLGKTNFIYQHEDIRQMDQLFAAAYDYFSRDHLYGALGKFYEIVSALIDDYQQETRLGLSPNQQYVIDAVEILKSEYTNSTLRIDTVAERVKVERTYLYRIFMRYLGVSPKSYLIQLRINQAIELLRNTNDAIGDIAIKVGFSSYVQFAKAFQKARQMSPSAFRKAISNGELSPRKID